MRTAANEARLAAAAGRAPTYILDGGIDGWRRAGLPVIAGTAQPIEVMRQVQLAAGALVLLGVLLGSVVAAVVGAGLMFAGGKVSCGMAALLRAMPWNRRKVAETTQRPAVARRRRSPIARAAPFAQSCPHLEGAAAGTGGRTPTWAK